MIPPDAAISWNDNAPWLQAMLLAYSELRDHEEAKRDTMIASAGRVI